MISLEFENKLIHSEDDDETTLEFIPEKKSKN